MGIFSRSTNTSDFNTPAVEGYGVEVNGDLMAIEESYADQLGIVKAIHAADGIEHEAMQKMAALESAGASEDEIEAAMESFEVAYEGAMSNIWDKIKAAMAKLWAKIKAFMESAVRFFDGFVKSGKAFAEKYETQLKDLKLDGYKHKMYTYTNLEDLEKNDVNAAVDSILEIIEKGAEGAGKKDDDDFDEYFEKDINEYRAALVGKSDEVEAGEFGEALFAHFRNGATGPTDMDDVGVKISEIIKTLKDQKAKTAVEKNETASAAMYNKLAGKLKKFEGDAKKAADKKDATEEDKEKNENLVRGAQRLAKVYSQHSATSLTFFRAWKTAISERDAAYKAICVGAFRYKKEK